MTLSSSSLELTLPVLRPGLRSGLPPSSLHAPSPSLSAPSPCWERDSDSEWAREGVSEPWLRGEEDRDGDSRNRRMAGWFSAAGMKILPLHTDMPELSCRERDTRDCCFGGILQVLGVWFGAHTLSEQLSSSGPPPMTKSLPAQLATAGELTASFMGATSVQRLEKES
ncbi:hypothetical protein EYF80_021930 [Liparis tanakae]|uniref:Uncharacterized protein n=1 Tax=Liparis tanakae TaxID=230148 RepID=A0A4Z2HPJ7_9TELE|nr:hypothetical protein EYF80_021930 [Liparis tanakae]